MQACGRVRGWGRRIKAITSARHSYFGRDWRHYHGNHNITTIDYNEPGSFDYRVYAVDQDTDTPVSLWHNVPLNGSSDSVFNMIVEIGKFSRAKMEISTTEPLNPIKQDTKNGQLRDYHGPIFWNYGALPQTWEDPAVKGPQEVLGCYGDNDPIDVIEIGSQEVSSGSIIQVKVLGALAMIDDGELDWKIIAIALSDPLAKDMNSVEDVDCHMPHTINGIREWFRWYKTPDGKPLNSFGYEEKALDSDFAVDVIRDTHQAWRELVSTKRGAEAQTADLWIGEEP
ncbi:hypothetical protein AAMO2058_001496200 [Amorphochlora amoebiformis]